MKNSSKALKTIIILVLMLSIISLLVIYFVFFNSNFDTNEEANSSSTKRPIAQAPDLDVTEVETANIIPTQTPSGLTRELTGYVVAIDEKNLRLSFDDALIVTSQDTKKIKELGLTELDLITGFTIYNENETIEEYALDSLVTINVYNRYETATMATFRIKELATALESQSFFANITVIDGKIYTITEQYLP